MKLPLVILFLLSFGFSFSQTNLYLVDGQSIDSVPKGLNWYALNIDNSISVCDPQTLFQEDEEQESKKKVANTHSNSVLIIGSKEKITERKGLEISEKQKKLVPKTSFKLSPSELLVATMLKDEYYSLLIAYMDTYEEAVIFRNCFQSKNKPSLGCIQPPFSVDFWGDLTNDGIPEILLSAKKEHGGQLKILIGKEGNIYKILFSSESE